MSSSRGSSGPRDQTHVSCGSCIAGGFFSSESLGKPSASGLSPTKDSTCELLINPFLIKLIPVGLFYCSPGPLSHAAF